MVEQKVREEYIKALSVVFEEARNRVESTINSLEEFILKDVNDIILSFNSDLKK